jgi:DNA repair ATPase RecN
MLTSLRLRNFTVFTAAEFQFASGLNVIVGENGSGKSHVLKTAYTVAAVSAWGERDSGSSLRRHTAKLDQQRNIGNRVSNGMSSSWPGSIPGIRETR